jgi:hypothetical protein
MEQVKVVKPVPGILNIGDILISPVEGADFCLEEVNVTSRGSNERFISLDYVTVSENVPQFFEFITDEFETIYDNEQEEECEECDCNCDCQGGFERSKDQVDDRYEFFKEKFEEAPAGSEAQIVYKNLMWFIEWLYGKQEVI